MSKIEPYDFSKTLEEVDERYGHLIDAFIDELIARGGSALDRHAPTSVRKGKPPIPWERVARVYLGHLYLGKSKEEAANEVRISASTIRIYRSQYKTFDEAVGAAIEDGFRVFEREASRRAIDGVRTYVTSGGRVVIDPVTGDPLTEQRHSDPLLMFMMKAKKPDVYGNKADLNLSGSINIEGARNTLLEKLAPILIGLIGPDDAEEEVLGDPTRETLKESD